MNQSCPWAVFNFDSRPLEVQVKLYLEPPLLSFYFPFMQWDIWAGQAISSFRKIAWKILDFHPFISFFFSFFFPFTGGRRRIWWKLPSLSLYCTNSTFIVRERRGRGEVRASECAAFYICLKLIVSSEFWRAAQLPGSPRQCPGMPAWLLSDRWMGLFLAPGPGNAVIIWKYNSFTCCTHPGQCSMVRLYQCGVKTINVNPLSWIEINGFLISPSQPWHVSLVWGALPVISACR